MPVTSVNDMADPALAFYAGAGLEWVGRPFTARVTYELERYDFRVSQGVERHDQLAVLKASVGFRLGR